MTQPSGRGRPRAAATDQAILQAALALFIDNGVEGVSIEQIAKRAKVGKATIYRRWSGKEDVIAAAIETLVTEDTGWTVPDTVDSQSPYALVEAAIDPAAAATSTHRYRALVARVFGSAVSHPELMARYWQRYILPRRRLATLLLERAQQEGTVPADTDLEVTIDMIVGAITYRVLQPNPPDADEMRRYLRQVYRQVGLLPDPANRDGAGAHDV
ncbi:TetR/AcrR family transcriptional regulator [Mycobacterium sp. MBM]|nr:TetR/AcrR family transcriptional regulator [Mycobacterium sp. MBM]